MKKNGQVGFSDFFISIVIVLGLFASFSFFWDQNLLSFNTYHELDGKIMVAQSIGDVLIRSTGSPNDWYLDSSNADSLGLAKDSHVLQQVKIDSLVMMDGSLLKRILGSRYSVKISIKELTGTILNTTSMIVPSEGDIIGITRYGALNGRPIELEVLVW